MKSIIILFLIISIVFSSKISPSSKLEKKKATPAADDSKTTPTPAADDSKTTPTPAADDSKTNATDETKPNPDTTKGKSDEQIKKDEAAAAAAAAAKALLAATNLPNDSKALSSTSSNQSNSDKYNQLKQFLTNKMNDILSGIANIFEIKVSSTRIVPKKQPTQNDIVQSNTETCVKKSDFDLTQLNCTSVNISNTECAQGYLFDKCKSSCAKICSEEEPQQQILTTDSQISADSTDSTVSGTKKRVKSSNIKASIK